MSKTKVYIDGQAGTTGLQIFDRIGAREDLELMRIDEDKRHDNEEERGGHCFPVPARRRRERSGLADRQSERSRH